MPNDHTHEYIALVNQDEDIVVGCRSCDYQEYPEDIARERDRLRVPVGDVLRRIQLKIDILEDDFDRVCASLQDSERKLAESDRACETLGVNLRKAEAERDKAVADATHFEFCWRERNADAREWRERHDVLREHLREAEDTITHWEAFYEEARNLDPSLEHLRVVVDEWIAEVKNTYATRDANENDDA